MKKLLRKPKVISKTGISGPTIWRLEKAGKFPKRLQISPGAVGWLEQDIDEWIESRTVVGARPEARATGRACTGRRDVVVKRESVLHQAVLRRQILLGPRGPLFLPLGHLALLIRDQDQDVGLLREVTTLPGETLREALGNTHAIPLEGA